MLSDKQLRHFNKLGFVVLRDFFSRDELKILIDEFEVGVAHVSAHEPCDGSKFHCFSMLGDDTPYSASMLEDQRLLTIAKQTFGNDLVGFMHLAYRYAAGGTEWHANDGSITHSNEFGFGPKFQWPLHEPVRADTGALRVIPGSHRPELHKQIAQSEAAGLLKQVDQVPSHACEANPGDVVFFDSRIYHGTWSPPDGPGDRKVGAIMYYQGPKTPQDHVIMRETLAGYFNNPPGNPWDAVPFKQWLANKPRNAARQQWTDAASYISNLTDTQIGMRREREPSTGQFRFVPVESA